MLDARLRVVLEARLRLVLEARFALLDGFGTLAPFSRASLSPIAIACFRLLTLPPELLRSVPALRRRIADSTVFRDPFPYFAMP